MELWGGGGRSCGRECERRSRVHLEEVRAFRRGMTIDIPTLMDEVMVRKWQIRAHSIITITTTSSRERNDLSISPPSLPPIPTPPNLTPSIPHSASPPFRITKLSIMTRKISSCWMTNNSPFVRNVLDVTMLYSQFYSPCKTPLKLKIISSTILLKSTYLSMMFYCSADPQCRQCGSYEVI